MSYSYYDRARSSSLAFFYLRVWSDLTCRAWGEPHPYIASSRRGISSAERAVRQAFHPPFCGGSGAMKVPESDRPVQVPAASSDPRPWHVDLGTLCGSQRWRKDTFFNVSIPKTKSSIRSFGHQTLFEKKHWIKRSIHFETWWFSHCWWGSEYTGQTLKCDWLIIFFGTLHLVFCFYYCHIAVKWITSPDGSASSLLTNYKCFTVAR